jgi:hypothetical protein
MVLYLYFVKLLLLKYSIVAAVITFGRKKNEKYFSNQYVLELCGSTNFISVPVPGFFGTEKPRCGFGYFQKRRTVQMYELILCMFRAFLLNRWIYAFVSLYKSLNILKHEIFLLKKKLKQVHNNNYHN